MALIGLQPKEPLDLSRIEELARSGFALAVQLLRNRDDAADAVQDALHSMLRKRRLFDPARGNVRAWFLKIVRNGCLDLIRKQGRRPTASNVSLEQIVAPHASPDEVAQTREELAILRRELLAMPAEHREAILLRDYHNLSYAEIATVLAVPAGTVMSRLHRARTELRDRMRRHWE